MVINPLQGTYTKTYIHIQKHTLLSMSSVFTAGRVKSKTVLDVAIVD